jgi:hypothetical protein
MRQAVSVPLQEASGSQVQVKVSFAPAAPRAHLRLGEPAMAFE